MKDTVLAQDSVTYIKLKSKIAQTDLEGDARWTIIPGDSLDTASIWVTTQALAITGMIAAINADANVDSFVTASDSGAAGYRITSDDAGLLFYAAGLDTTQDAAVSELQGNVTSESSDDVTVGIGKIAGWKTLTGRLFVDRAQNAHAGQGGACSTWVWLYTRGPDGRVLIDSAVADTDTVGLIISISEGLGDTLLRQTLEARVKVWDTLSDSTYEAKTPLDVDLLAK